MFPLITFQGILETFGFGHLNPFSETKSVQISQRRSTSVSAMNTALRTHYSKNCLTDVTEYYGVVAKVIDRSVVSYANKNSWAQREGVSGIAADPYQVYKVYLPELECRPEPESELDPVIATYEEIPAAPDLSMTIAVGAIVKIAYGDPFSMRQPEIVAVEGAVPGGSMPVSRLSIADTHGDGNKLATTTGGGASGAETDFATKAAVNTIGPSNCGSARGSKKRGCMPGKLKAIPGNNNWRSARIKNFEMLKYLRDAYQIKTIINLAADSMYEQKDDRAQYGPSGNQPCGLANKDQGDFTKTYNRPNSCCGGGDINTKAGCTSVCPNACEPLWADKLGMTYLKPGGKPIYIGGRPGPLKRAWNEIEAALKEGNCLIHCKAGTDRTGAVVGRWKKITQGTDDEALLKYVRTTGASRQPTRGCDDEPGGTRTQCGWDKKNRRLKKWMLS